MKELKTYPTGRLPIWQQDLAWIQTAPKEVLLALINELGLGKTNFIITGCTITTGGGMVAMTGGWAYFNNEILPVAQIESTVFSGTPLVKLTKVTRCEGQKAYELIETTENRDAYQNDYMSGTILSIYTGEAYDFAIRQGAWTLKDRITNVNAESDWIELYNSIYYKRIGKMVYVKGNIVNDAQVDSFTNYQVTTRLPVPAAGVTKFPATESGTTLIQIDGSGVLTVSSSSNRVSFNHISYLTTTAYIASDGHMSNQGGGGQRHAGRGIAPRSTNIKLKTSLKKGGRDEGMNGGKEEGMKSFKMLKMIKG